MWLYIFATILQPLHIGKMECANCNLVHRQHQVNCDIPLQGDPSILCCRCEGVLPHDVLMFWPQYYYTFYKCLWCNKRCAPIAGVGAIRNMHHHLHCPNKPFATRAEWLLICCSCPNGTKKPNWNAIFPSRA